MPKTFENARPLNFSETEDRKQMESAITRVRAELGSCFRLGDGQKVSEKTDRFVPSVNPSQKDQIVGHVEFGDVSQIDGILDRLSNFSSQWKNYGVERRAQLVSRLADWFEERRADLAAWMVFETGKTWEEADGDVVEAIDFCRYYAFESKNLFEPKLTQELPGETNYLFYQGRGVGVVLAPWNFPLAILTGLSTATLVTGNCVVIKPAEQSSVIASFLAQGLREVGFPADSFYFFPAVGEDVGPPLVADRRVNLICFTGSAEVGFQIIESASKPPSFDQRGIKKVIAEMGGKNALIIDEDADLDEAVAGAIKSAFGFQGQKCSALSRLLVHENVYASFVTRFVEATKSLQIGDSSNTENQIGPVIDEEAQKRILATIKKAESRLKCLFKADSIPSDGYYVPPTIFEVEDREDDLFQNEIFGPVVAIKKIHDLDEALDDANAVRYALTGGVYSRSPTHIEKVKSEFDVGNLYINRAITGSIVQRQPFGGFKHSGVGSKAGGPDYLVQFVEPRTITENTVRRGFAPEQTS